MFPPSVEDWVGEDHPARFIRDFVDSLDLSELEIEIPDNDTGRPPYAPDLLFKVWLFGYFNRIRWALHAVDGTKIQAVSSNDKARGRNSLERTLETLSERLDRTIADAM